MERATAVTSLKIGTDICSVERITAVHERFGERFLRRILTDREIAYVQGDPVHMATRLAGRFAAKEAVAKALGTGWYGLDWKEVEIIHYPSGEPGVLLHGRAQALAAKRELKKFEVSISHERLFAVAFVVAHSL
jgi:holo-[acyl-carrier protein] synthase